MISSYQVRILNHITWKKITQFDHPAAINNTKAVSILQPSWWTLKASQFTYLLLVIFSRLCIRKWRKGQLLAVMTFHYTTSQSAPLSSTLRANVCWLFPVFRKVRSGNQLCQITNSVCFFFFLHHPDEICPLPVQIPVVKPDPDRANPKIGVSTLAFSSDSRYLATKNGKISQLSSITLMVSPRKTIILIASTFLFWPTFYSVYVLRVVLNVYMCFSDGRQHDHCCLGVGHAEDEPGGCAGADISHPLLPVGPSTPPPGTVHSHHQTLSLVPSRMRFCPSPHWR